MKVINKNFLPIIYVLLNAQYAISDPSKSLTLMVIGWKDSRNMDDVEMIDFSQNAQKCSKPIRYPLVGQGTFGSFVDGRAFVCSQLIDTRFTSRSCYEYLSSTQNWKEMNMKLFIGRYQAATVLIGTKFVVAGGYNGLNKLPPTIIYDLNAETVRYAKKIPEARNSATMIALNETTIMMLGGTVFPSSKTLFFNIRPATTRDIN